jgi:antirestriction protein ArdC
VNLKEIDTMDRNEYEEKSKEHFSRHIESIVAQLEAGTVPWQKTWRVGQNCVANLASGRPYTGFSNIMVLSFAGYSSPWWITEPKIKEFCGTLNEGEENNFRYVFYWHRQKISKTVNGEEREFTNFYPRTHKVWNVEQTSGIVHHRLVNPDPFKHEEINPSFEQIRENYFDAKGPGFKENPGACFYNVGADYVSMPPAGDFEHLVDYCAAFLHEMAHSTGHKKRLNRKELAESKNMTDYGVEELTAEMAASYMLTVMGFDDAALEKTFQNTSAYLHHWVEELKENPRVLINASTRAHKRQRS